MAPRRKPDLAGTNLHLSPDGVYQWRRVDPLTGRRKKRSTGQRDLALAIRAAARFEDEWDRRRAGLKTYEGWKAELEPLSKAWLDAIKADLSTKTHAQKTSQISRALELLKLRVAADLDDVATVNDRVMALESEDTTRDTLRRTIQHPLKQFSAWLAANKRHLDRDPLLTWAPVPAKRDEEPEQARRAFLPDEVARAFLALDRLDAIQGRKHAQRPAFLLMLITVPRVSALLSRDVEHFDRERKAVVFGKSVGTKHKGAGALDAKTAADLLDYLGERSTGSLVLGPMGGRLTKERFLDEWREAFSLGLVDALWPRSEAKDLVTVHLVSLALLSGKVRVNRGGNPKLILPETIAARVVEERRVGRIVELLRDDWTGRMVGVDVHAFRKTHRSWAEAEGVPPVLIDKQLGHEPQRAAQSMELLKLIRGSTVGRKHYLDVDSTLFDAGRSAEAVRRLLDQALEAVRQDQTTVLVPKVVSVAKEASG